MSAIAGIVNFNKEPINSDHSRNMMKSLDKFPANDVRIFQKDNVFFGCHAQWITPESIGEPLPFYDSERQCVITADAIIDNREELFDKLNVEKHKRKTMPDSQVILLAYNKWGEDSPKYLIGDFAFMIWDEREQKLFGARDFSGARTLYYYQNGNQVAFCTIIGPIYSLPVKKELNEIWLADYLAIGGMIDATDTSITPYKKIRQVSPSQSITLYRDKIKFNQYCNITSDKHIKFKSNSEYVEAFQEVFESAVKSRLRTHLNVGAQLSGGLDSGAVTSYAAKALKIEEKKLYTYSYIPPDDFKDFTPKQLLADERPYIYSTVHHVGNIKDKYLAFEGKNSYLEIDSLLEILETPYKFFENSFWLKGMFESAKQEDVGVLLNGDRGNFTISWGSALDYYATLLKKLRLIRFSRELNLYCENVGGPRLRRIPIILRIGFPVLDKVFPERRPKVFPRPSLVNQQFAERTGVFDRFKSLGISQQGWYPGLNIYQEREKHFDDVFQWNAGNTLAAKLSLKYSMSKRDPTNDIRVVRFCLSLSEDQYVQNGLDRFLVRQATRDYLPDKVRLNQRIRGVQGADWVHRMLPFWDSFINEIRELSSDPMLLEFINGEVLNRAIQQVPKTPLPEHATDPNYKILMRVLVFYRYIKQFH